MKRVRKTRGRRPSRYTDSLSDEDAGNNCPSESTTGLPEVPVPPAPRSLPPNRDVLGKNPATADNSSIECHPSFNGTESPGENKRSDGNSKRRSRESKCSERRSRSKSRERHSKSKPSEGCSKSKSSERRSKSKSSERRSESKSSKRRSESKSSDRRSRSKSSKQRSQSKSSERRSKSKSSERRSKSKSSERRSKSKSSERRSQSKSNNPRSRSKSSNRRSKSSNRRSRSKSSNRRSRSKSSNRRSWSKSSKRRSQSKSSERRSQTKSCKRRRSKSKSSERRSNDRRWKRIRTGSHRLSRSLSRTRSESPRGTGGRRRSASLMADNRNSDARDQYLYDEVLFRKTVVQGLASTKAVVLNLAKRYPYSDTSAAAAQELEVISARLPVTSSQELKQLDEDIKADGSLYKKLVSYLSLTGGDDVGSTTRSVFRKLVSDEVQMLYSWEGLKKKERLDRRVNLLNAVYDSVRRHFPNATEKTMKTSITTDLRNAKQRVDSKKNKKDRAEALLEEETDSV